MLDFSVTLIITIINIAVLTFILRLILFKPVTKFMTDRAKRIQDSIEQSEKDKNQAKKLLEDYEARLKSAEAAAEQILEAAREEARTEAAEIIAQGKVQAQGVIAAARSQMEAEKQAAFARFHIEAAALVMAASSRLVQRELNAEDNRHYVDMLLNELTARKGMR